MGKVSALRQDQASGAVDWSVTASAPRPRKVSGRGLREAYIALLVFMVIYCSRPEDWIPGLSAIPLEKISGVLALAALLASIWSLRERLPREAVYLILLTGQMFAAALFATVSWRAGLHGTLDFAKVLLLVIVIVLSVRTMTRLRSLIIVQALSVAVIAAVTVWKGHMINGRLYGVLGNDYGDANDLALTIIISLPLCLAFLILSKRWIWKLSWGVAILAMLYAVFLSGSRGGFFALIVTAAVCLWEFGIRGRRYFLLVIVALAGVVFWQSSGKLIRGRLEGILDPKNDVAAAADNLAASAYSSAQQREQLLSRSIDLTLEHPLLGVGPGNFIWLSGNWHVTHNSYTEMSSEAGIPALVLYVLILWAGFANLQKIKRFPHPKRDIRVLAACLKAALAGFIVGSFFLSLAYQFFAYFLVTYTTALVFIARQSAKRSKEHELLRETSREESLQGTRESIAHL